MNISRSGKWLIRKTWNRRGEKVLGWEVAHDPLLFDEHLHQHTFPRACRSYERHKLGITGFFAGLAVGHKCGIPPVVVEHGGICSVFGNAKPGGVLVFHVHPLRGLRITIWT